MIGLPLWVLLLSVSLLWGSEEWLEFRGPNGQGRADAAEVPLTWSETQNVKWKLALPGRGASSPVILSNHVWLTTATRKETSLRALCVARDSGRILRDLELFSVRKPERLTSDLSGLASPTPVAEPGRVYFSFGTYGNAAVAADTGRILWTNQQFVFGHDNCGPGSSPILYRGFYIINCDGTEVRYVAALDKTTGQVAWRAPRSNPILTGPGASKSFCTPVVTTVQGQDQLISPGSHRVSAYDPRDGRELWAVDLPGWAIVPRPVCGSNVVYVGTGGMKPELWCIRADGRGVVTDTHVVWKFGKQAPMVASPLLAGRQLYMVSEAGIVTCLDALTGRELWSGRISGSHYASPLLAAGRIYFFGQNGVTTVIKPDTQLTVLATNRLESGCLATPAVAGKAFYLRTKTHLYRLEG